MRTVGAVCRVRVRAQKTEFRSIVSATMNERATDFTTGERTSYGLYDGPGAVRSVTGSLREYSTPQSGGILL